MIEKDVEQHLRKKVKSELRGMALKFVSPGFAGVPDRIVLLPGGRVVFVETKAPGKKLRRLQEYVRDLIRGLGFRVLKIDTKDGVDKFIEEEKASLTMSENEHPVHSPPVFADANTNDMVKELK